MRGGAGDPAVERACLRFQAPCNPIVAFLPVEDDEMLGQTILIVLKCPHLDGSSGTPAGGEKSMAVGEGGRHHILYERRLRQLCPTNRERHDPPAVEEQNPANRTAEQQLALAVLQV